MEIKILVATHKNYKMPMDTDTYVPVFVGKETSKNHDVPFIGDNSGENISSKNYTYNELTALYWGWKNLSYDVLGLVHYRRYLSMNHSKNINQVLSKKNISKLMKNNDIILPTKRNYFIESNDSHYRHAHQNEPLDITRKVILNFYPEYLDSFDKVMRRKKAHMFNMFIMKKEPLDKYCNWMFDVLKLVEDRVDMSEYSDYEKRVLGFISELLLDVWLDVNNKYKVVEVNYVFMESQNWIIKGGKFLLRKIRGHA